MRAVGRLQGISGGSQTQQPVSAASCRQARPPVRRINDRGHGRVNLCQHEKLIKLLSPASHSLKQRARLYCESPPPPPKKKKNANTLSFCLCLSPAKQYTCKEQLFYQTGSCGAEVWAGAPAGPQTLHSPVGAGEHRTQGRARSLSPGSAQLPRPLQG